MQGEPKSAAVSLVIVTTEPQLQEYLGISWDLCVRSNIITTFIAILSLLMERREYIIFSGMDEVARGK